MLFALGLFTVCGFAIALFGFFFIVGLQAGAYFVAAAAALIAVTFIVATVQLAWTAIRA